MGVEFQELRKLEKAIETIGATRDDVISSIAKRLAAELLRMVVKRTPVGNGNYYVQFSRYYEADTGKTGKARYIKNKSGKNKGKVKFTATKVTGGTLRRGWTVDNKVLMFGDTYAINVFNNVFYATYVENGHEQTPGRFVPHIYDPKTDKFGKKLKRSWVPGKHMLKISTEELQKQAQPFVEKKVNQWLNEVMK